MHARLTFIVSLIGLIAPLVNNAQEKRSAPSFSSKASRTAPVDVSALHATVINGQQSKPNGRIQATSHSYFHAGYIPTFTGLPTVPTGLEVKKSAQSGLPIFIKGALPNNPNARMDAKQTSFAYLNAVKDLMRIQNPAAEFEVGLVETDQLNQSHQRMKQMYQGIPVYGGEVILHSQNGQVQALNGRNYPTPNLVEIRPSVTQSQAIQQATLDLQTRTRVYNLSSDQRKLLDYQKGPDVQLVIYHEDEGIRLPQLAWHISIRPNYIEHWEYFVNAQTGAIIHQHNNTCSLDGVRTATAKDLNGVNRVINTYQSGANYYIMDASRAMFNVGQSKFPEEPVGIIWTLDAKNTHGDKLTASHISVNNNVWNNPGAVSAHYNGGKAFEYYKNVHGRNAINGQGGNIISLINVADDDGKGMDNAYWNGKAIFYGNGNTGFKPLAGALDVAGHEMTHGVIGNSANLEYKGQSGAINESMADVFGIMIDSDDWTLGEDVVKTSSFPSGALRNMSDPHNGGTSLNNRGYQPRIMTELYTGEEDNGGVHINSGIPNYACFLFTSVVGRSKAEKVYYRALTQYLTTKSQFVDLRLAVIQAATDLHGANSAEVTAAKTAFDKVGIFETGGGNTGGNELPANPGQDFILMHDASNTDPNSWYTSSPTGTNLKALSKTEAKGRPSVTDDGSTAVFVSRDGKIRSITLSATPQETIIQNQTIWSNVAISKDGTKLAAVTSSSDTSIYVYDYGKQKWGQFKLYNPTYSSGVAAKGVQYADALEWDYTGEYLVYDAYNIIKKSTGASIDYWDVGVIRVWDKAKNDFGNGTIEKIFTDLPENVSIGNPTFSKKSPYIAAFDYVNTAEDSYKLIAANLQTGDAGLIADNTTLSFPTYSKADDKIAFTTINNGDTVVSVIDLKIDKINPKGTASIPIITEAKWAVWFAQGSRQVLSDEKNINQFAFAGLNPPVSGTINGNNITAVVDDTVNVTKLVATFTHSALAKVKVGSLEQVSGTTKNNFTQPITYTVIAQNGSTKNYTVTITKAIKTGVDDPIDESDKVTLYPNPSSDGRFQLTWNRLVKAPIQVEVVTVTGKRIYQQTISAYTSNQGLELQLPSPQVGLYLLHMRSDNTTVYKKLLVK
jgi:Zn-dependent metalloprotease